MSVVEQETEETRDHTEPVARTATARSMFKYSEFVDVGEGAAECEHSRDGECDDPEHFHAWCRLPNSYQEADIAEKAQAAKARRIRALKDPEADISVVLEAELAKVNDPSYLETIIDELVAEHFPEDYLEARVDTLEIDEFEHFQQDQEEYERLHAAEGQLPREEQSEEYRRLHDHLQKFVDAVNEKCRTRQEPRRIELRERTFEAVITLLRDKRVDSEGTRAFGDAYKAWTCFAGTFRVELHETLRRPFRPAWAEIGLRDRAIPGTMFGEAPEVLDALDTVYNDLRISLRRGSAGN